MTGAGQGSLPPDLSLLLRLDALRKSLEQIAAIDRAVQGGREEVTRLEETTGARSGLTATLKRLKADIAKASDLLEDVAETHENAREGYEALQKARKTVDDVMRKTGDDMSEEEGPLEALTSVVQRMRTRWEELPTTRLEDANTTLSAKCQPRITAIKEMERRLEKGEVNDEARADMWAAYEDIAFQDGAHRFDGEQLFAEYVDFLGGLALRNTGIDEGVCYMADELLEQCHRMSGNILWHSMTVPARRMPPETTIARMIRLGFPEWTIWAVPLGAHEFGHVVVSENHNLREAIEEEGLPREDIAVYLADAFATYFMGPSYAYASVLLALDPYAEDPYAGSTAPTARAAEGDGGLSAVSPHSCRAYVILKTLERMDAEAYQGVRDTVDLYWRNALAAFSLEFDLGEARTKLDRTVELMHRFLESDQHHLRYQADQWERVVNWPGLTVTSADDFPLKLTKDDLRDIINAAWHQRIRDPDQATGVNADSLATAAQGLWRARLSKHRSSSGIQGRYARRRS